MTPVDPKASLDTLICDELLPLVTDMHDRLQQTATEAEVATLHQQLGSFVRCLTSVETRLEKLEFRFEQAASKADLARRPTTPFMVYTVIALVVGICGVLIGSIAVAS